jgi:phage terminase large subunit
MKISLRSLIAPHFWNTFNSKITHQIDKGGRGGTKTSKNCLKVGYHTISEARCSAICIRKYQNTLRNSLFKEIKRAFSRFNLKEGVDYKSSVSPMQIKLYNNNHIYFAGLDDYEKLKGFIDEDRPIKIVYFSEVTEFDNEEEMQQVIATFSRGNTDWFIVIYEFNPPKNKFHWVNEWCEKMSKRDDVLITSSDYRTVPQEWLGKMFIEEAERLKQYDEKRYRWIYLGEVIGIEGMIYNPDLFKYVKPAYIEDNKLRVLYVDFAIDSGHQTSATVCGAYGYASDGNWYLLDTYYYSPQEKQKKKAPSELSLDIFNFQISVLKKYQTTIDRETIDSAEGALRNQLFKDYGKRINPVNKGKDKEELIEYSQDFLAKGKFFILDNPNNKIFKKETENYKWKEDSVEKRKPEPDKTEKELPSTEIYYNSHSKEYSYYYADHTCDAFQYWVKDNLQKLGLKY